MVLSGKITRPIFAFFLVFVTGVLGINKSADAGSNNDGFERLKTLAGDWVEVDGIADGSRQIAARYSVTASGTAVMETLFPGMPHEMITLYTRDGKTVALTHYCAAGNQPHMHAGEFNGHSLSFVFDGGANVNPKTDMHMHSVKHQFVNDNELRSEWQSWDKGKASGAPKVFHLTRLATS